MARGRVGTGEVSEEQRQARERGERVRALLELLERERDGIEREIERLRRVVSVWELTIKGMERQEMRLVGVRKAVGTRLRVYRDPIRLKEQPEDYSRSATSPSPQKRVRRPSGAIRSS